MDTLKHRVMIGYPTTRPLDLEHVGSLLQTREFLWCPIVNRPADIGRNMVVEAFLQSDAEYLLFADSDATWAPGSVDRLVSRNLPMVCGIFFKRDIPPVPTIGPRYGFDVTGRPTYAFGETIKRINERMRREKLNLETVNNNLLLEKSDDDLMPVDGCGMHFVLIRRDVFNKVKPPYFQHFAKESGEDFAFCQKVRDAKIQIFADLSVYSGHISGPGINLGLKQFLMYWAVSSSPDPSGEVWNMPA